jgi:hypothetical protein
LSDVVVVQVHTAATIPSGVAIDVINAINVSDVQEVWQLLTPTGGKSGWLSVGLSATDGLEARTWPVTLTRI